MSSLEIPLPSKATPSAAVSPTLFRARVELNLDIPNPFEPKPSQAVILSLSPNIAKPAKLELLGLSQLEFKKDQYTLRHLTLPRSDYWKPEAFCSSLVRCEVCLWILLATSEYLA